MKRTATIISFLLLLGGAAFGQRGDVEVRLSACDDTVLYLSRHYRDALLPADTARRAKGGSYHFRRTLAAGIYAIVRQDGSTVMADIELTGKGDRFRMEDSRSLLSPANVRVSGSDANRQLMEYKARMQQARVEADSIRARLDRGDSAARADQDRLVADMEAYEARALASPTLFMRLTAATKDPSVPDTVTDKARYYRRHYWDATLEAVAARRVSWDELRWSPQLFSRMNYFFFGLLYHADSDTICAELDRLMDHLVADTAMTRYVLQFIEPKYFRSTRNIGWDAVWCHMAERYFLRQRYPWYGQGSLFVMEKNLAKIRQSLIGAHGQELWMLDTTQVDAPEHWRSSHRFPERYVILWFWDPDCSHCQQYTAELKDLYNRMLASHKKRFEVYAVGYESDVPKWRRYVRDHELPFVNVGGMNVNIDYQEAYNVHGAPTMIILNDRRDIIMNKVIPISSIEAFLDEYEAGRL